MWPPATVKPNQVQFEVRGDFGKIVIQKFKGTAQPNAQSSSNFEERSNRKQCRAVISKHSRIESSAEQ